MEEKKTFGSRFKKDVHLRRKIVMIAAGAVVAVAGSYVLVKNWDHVSDFVVDLAQKQTVPIDVVPKVNTSRLPELTGDKFTATGLGSMVSMSGQAINKKIVEAGLAIKLGDGSYAFTELGRSFGERIIKTKGDWVGPNIEWDKAILEIIFSPEELAKGLAEKARQDALMSA